MVGDVIFIPGAKGDEFTTMLLVAVSMPAPEQAMLRDALKAKEWTRAGYMLADAMKHQKETR